MTITQKEVRSYMHDLLEKTAKTDYDALAAIIDKLIGVKEGGGKIFSAGNGGSLTTASHMANDFTKGCRVLGRTGFDIECLGDGNAVITCLANDFSYDDIFSIQLQTKAKRGDALVVYSGSGNSGNLVKAAQTANEMGLTVIGFLGRDGGKLRALCDLCLIAPSDGMEQIEDMHMIYEHTMVCAVRAALSERWGMEIVKQPPVATRFSHALFDFDGTISLIREGWQEIMIPYFIDVLLQTPQVEDKKTITTVVTDFVDLLTGKQTIFQCIRLDEEVVRRGGAKTDPGVYKAEYLRRLEIHIKDRVTALRNGGDVNNYLVPGVCRLLERLKEEGCRLYLASGTDEESVLEEARLLGMDRYFGDDIYGARDNMTTCSKEIVIKDIIREHHLTGAELVSFGDGFVEIELVADIGGYAVGVATDEVRKKGVNEHKRQRLLVAGASMIIPDFSGADRLVDRLMGVRR